MPPPLKGQSVTNVPGIRCYLSLRKDIRDRRDKNGTIRRTNGTNSALRRESQRPSVVEPTHFQASPELFVRDVQVALRLLNARVAEHQLNDADVDAVREQPAGALVPQVVPSQVDALHLLSVPFRSLLSGPGLDV